MPAEPDQAARVREGAFSAALEAPCPDAKLALTDGSKRPSAGFSAGHWATVACLLDVLAPKPGNVHRGADFEDLTFADFALAAVAIGPAIDRAADGGSLGSCLLEAVRAMRTVAGSNTHLGSLLLLIPLAQVPPESDFAVEVPRVLARLTADDAALVYQAIREAQPGGLGEVPEADVHAAPPADLLAAMRLAAERDLVARQYDNGFADVLGRVVPDLAAGIAARQPLTQVIVRTFLVVLAELPDSLIARKLGLPVAQAATARAGRVLASGAAGDSLFESELADFDFWLRADGHRRNPGTTADLVTAGLFVLLRQGKLAPPWHVYRKDH